MATTVCPNCGNPVRPGAKFCARCGSTLVAPMPNAPAVPAVPPAPQKSRTGLIVAVVAIVAILLLCICLITVIGIMMATGNLQFNLN